MAMNSSDFDSNITVKVGYVNGTFTLLFFLIGLPWNIMVIAIILKKKLYSQPSVMLMLNLAISSFLVCLLIMPITILFGLGGMTVFGDDYDNVCKSSFLNFLLALVSALTVALMSVDRVIYLKKPLKYKLIVTPCRTRVAIVLVWIISMPGTVTIAVEYHRDLIYYPYLATCIITAKHYQIFLLMVYTTTIIIQLIGFFCVIYIARSHLKKKLSRSLEFISSIRGRSQREDGERSIALNNYRNDMFHLAAIFGASFFLGLLPLVVFLIFAANAIITFATTSRDALPTIIFSAMAYIFFLSTSLTYPIVEVTMIRELRSAVFELCVTMCKTCCSKKS